MNLLWTGFLNLIKKLFFQRKVSIVRFKNITAEFNPKNSELVTFGITPKSNGRFFDIQWKLNRTIPNQLMMGVDGFFKINNLYKDIFSYEFDMCRLWDGFMSQTIARMWFKNIKRYGNMSMTCPIKKVLLLISVKYYINLLSTKGNYFLKKNGYRFVKCSSIYC